MIDEKIENLLFDIGLVRGYSSKTAQYYRLPTMEYSFIWIYYNESGEYECECNTPTDLYIINGVIYTTIYHRHFSKVSDAIPAIKYLIRRYKELSIELKKTRT